MVATETGEVQRAGCSWEFTTETEEVQIAGCSWEITTETDSRVLMGCYYRDRLGQESRVLKGGYYRDRGGPESRMLMAWVLLIVHCVGLDVKGVTLYEIKKDTNGLGRGLGTPNLALNRRRQGCKAPRAC